MRALSRSFDAVDPVVIRIGFPEGLVEIDVSHEPRVDIEVTSLRERERALDDVSVDAVERGGRLEVDVRAQSGRSGLPPWRGSSPLRVRLRCPRGAALEVDGVAVDVRATGCLGTVKMKTASGGLTVDEVEDLSVQSASGDVSAGGVVRDAVVKTASGDVDLRAVGGDLEVFTASGDVEVGQVSGAVRASTVSGDVEIRDLGAGATVNTVSGDVELAVPAGRRLWLDVRSASGDVESDLEVAGTRPDDGIELVELTVRTVSGDVRLRRSRA